MDESEELQRAATDADAIAKLASFVRCARQLLLLLRAVCMGGWGLDGLLHPCACRRDTTCSPRLREGALRTLGTLCADKEEHRRQLVDCKVLPQIAAALWESSAPAVRAAACLCMRSLSRSTKLLRWGCTDAAGA